MSVRILHIADIHLDAPFRWLGDRGADQRAQVRRTFERVCGLAKEHDLMLIAGDLFDSNAVSQWTLEWAIGLLSGIGIPICILPGTHDGLGPDCVYHRPEWQRAGNAHLLISPQTQSARFDDLSVCVHARPVAGNENAGPLQGIRRDNDTRWNVALAHGSVIIPGRISEDTDCPIQTSEIGRSGMDYIALGHWHSWYDPGCRVKAVYPGSPEILKFGQSSISVASVTLSDSGVQVEPIVVGKRRCREETASVDGLDSTEAIKALIAEWADPDLILRAALTGLLDAGLALDAEEMASELAERFFHLELRDETHPKLTADALDFPERTVIGRFVRSLREEIEKTGDERVRKLAEDALQLGVALLRGRNVLR